LRNAASAVIPDYIDLVDFKRVKELFKHVRIVRHSGALVGAISVSP